MSEEMLNVHRDRDRGLLVGTRLRLLSFLRQLFIIPVMRPLSITRAEFAQLFQAARPPSGWPARIGELLVCDF